MARRSVMTMETVAKDLPKGVEIRLNHSVPGHPLHSVKLISADQNCRKELFHHGRVIAALQGHEIVQPHSTSHSQSLTKFWLVLSLIQFQRVHGVNLERSINVIMN